MAFFYFVFFNKKIHLIGTIHAGGSGAKPTDGDFAARKQRNGAAGETAHPRGIRRRSLPVSYDTQRFNNSPKTSITSLSIYYDMYVQFDRGTASFESIYFFPLKNHKISGSINNDGTNNKCIHRTGRRRRRRCPRD